MHMNRGKRLSRRQNCNDYMKKTRKNNEIHRDIYFVRTFLEGKVTVAPAS